MNKLTTDMSIFVVENICDVFSEYGIYIVPAKILKLLIKKLIVWISFESCLEVNCLNHKFWTEDLYQSKTIKDC